MDPKKIKSLLFAILPLVIAVLIMTPRLTSAQFGFLDDGYILNEVREILSGDFSMRLDLEAGRFRPFYWLYFTLIYALAGPNPFWFFFGHLIILLILIVEIRFLMHLIGANDWQTLLTSILFLFSIPIIENFYTLSKGETLQLVFLLAALIWLEKLKASTQKVTTWTYAVLAVISVLSAILAKETSYILMPLVILWAAYVIYQRRTLSPQERRAYLIFLGATLTATALYFLFRAVWGAPPAAGGTYTGRYAFSLMSFLSRVPRWLTLYVFYFHYLLPMVVIVMIFLFNKTFENVRLRHNLFYWGGWILAWSVGFLPWEYAEVYYLLPFSVGVSIVAGLLSPHIQYRIKSGTKFTRWLMSSLSILFTLLFLASLTHYRTHALAQLTFDRMNKQMMTYTKEILPEDGDLIMGVNTYNEYFQNMGHFLIDQDGMTELTFDFVSLEILSGMDSRSDAILLLPHIENQPNLLLRAGVEEAFTMAWVEEIHQTMEGRLLAITHFRGGFRINNINLPVIACPLLGNRGFCANPDPFFDSRTFSYGWDLYLIR